MPRNKILFIPIVVIVITTLLTTIGCGKNENQRLADMAERNLQRQDRQNRQMVTLQREVQAEWAETSRQRDALEQDPTADRRPAPP